MAETYTPALSAEQLDSLRLVPVDSERIPNRLMVARRMVGLTQYELAAAVRTYQARISDIENGKRQQIPLDLAQDLATFFGATVEDLFPRLRQRAKS